VHKSKDEAIGVSFVSSIINAHNRHRHPALAWLNAQMEYRTISRMLNGNAWSIEWIEKQRLMNANNDALKMPHLVQRREGNAEPSNAVMSVFSKDD
jgi:hypothetical protein